MNHTRHWQESCRVIWYGLYCRSYARIQLKALQIGNSQSELLAECFRELLSIAFVYKLQDKPMRSGPLLSRFWWFVQSQDAEVIGGFHSHYSHTAKTRLFRKVKLFGVITAKMRCCIMLFYYDLLPSPTLVCYVLSIWHCKFHLTILYFVMHLHILLCTSTWQY